MMSKVERKACSKGSGQLIREMTEGKGSDYA